MAKATTKQTKERKLPEMIYGAWSDDKPEDQYVRTSEDAEGLLDGEKQLRVGIYELTGYADVKNFTTITPRTKR